MCLVMGDLGEVSFDSGGHVVGRQAGIDVDERTLTRVPVQHGFGVALVRQQPFGEDIVTIISSISASEPSPDGQGR